MRGLNIYTCFFLAKPLMINELQHDTTLYTTPPGFQLIGVYPGVSPLARLHHRAILWRPCQGSGFVSLRSRYLGGGTAAAVVKNARWAW